MGKSKISTSNSKKSSSRLSNTTRSIPAYSNSSVSRRSSKTSRSALSNAEKSSRKIKETNKIIYKASDAGFKLKFTQEDGLPIFFITWLQAFQLIFCGIVALYNYYRDADPILSFIVVMIVWAEVSSLMVILALMLFKSLAYRSFALVYQFMHFYAILSIFVQTFDAVFADTEKRGFAEMVLNPGTMLLVGCVDHFIILMGSINFLGNGRAKIDNSNRIIIESTQRRRRKMYSMVASLLQTLCLDQMDTNIDMAITDETGKVMKLEGTEVKADSKKMVTMTLDPNQIEVRTVNTTGASLEVVSEPPTPATPQIQFVTRQGPLFNYVLEQDTALTPRSIV